MGNDSKIQYEVSKRLDGKVEVAISEFYTVAEILDLSNELAEDGIWSESDWWLARYEECRARGLDGRYFKADTLTENTIHSRFWVEPEVWQIGRNLRKGDCQTITA